MTCALIKSGFSSLLYPICMYVLMSVCFAICLSCCLSHVCLTVCLSVCLTICLSVCLAFCLYCLLSVLPSVCLSCFLSHRISNIVIHVTFNYYNDLYSFVESNLRTLGEYLRICVEDATNPPPPMPTFAEATKMKLVTFYTQNALGQT